jgi:hypothetical protein
MSRPWIVLMFALGACGHRVGNSPSTIRGTYLDIKTEAGDYQGYKVVRSCRSGMIAVRSHGSHSPASLGALASALYDAHLVPSVAMAGDGVGCESTERAVYVFLSDFREVDTAVARIGAYLSAHDLNAEVVIAMSGRPELL